ncbi:MAG: hypothetical protein D6819_08795 [Gammaproteobacteria bacterium]|nr:MAG: hypothetical protein D6819_08795 [Gammaproteobacteria bacterium]
MRLDYEIIEDVYDETTLIRTLTEQAVVPERGWLIRTTLYTPHHITCSMTFIPSPGAEGRLFDLPPHVPS